MLILRKPLAVIASTACWELPRNNSLCFNNYIIRGKSYWHRYKMPTHWRTCGWFYQLEALPIHHEGARDMGTKEK